MTEPTTQPTTKPTTKTDAADGEAPELIERYVHEVTRRLLPQQRADVRRELRSSLLDALEDRFGPEPTWVQAAILLRETGPPREVAASYRPQDRYLVGPEWYPAFTRVLRIVLTAYVGLLVAAYAFAIVFRGGSDVGASLFGVLGSSVEGGLVAFAVVVAIFHLLQRTERAPAPASEWDPGELPPVSPMDVVGRGEAVLEIILPAGFLALLYAFRDQIGVTVEPGGTPLLNDLFLTYLPWITGLILVEMALGVVLVWRGRWTWPTRGVKLAIDLFAIGVFSRLAADVVAARPRLIAAGVPELAATLIGQLAWWVPAVIAAIVVLKLAKRAFQSWRARRRDRSAQPT